MTLYQVIKQEQDKHPNKLIGDDIALQVMEEGEEIYFEDCMQAEGDYDYDDLINAEVKSVEYVESYGDLEGKLKLILEVE